MDPVLRKLMMDKKQPVLLRWQKAAMGFDMHKDVIKSHKPGGRFSDPMTFLVEKSTEQLWDWLADAENTDLYSALENLCRLKAVQDDSPKEALGFIFELKQIIRDELPEGREYRPGILELDKRIDEIALLAFDIYSRCRAQIYELQINEIKRMYGRDAG